LLINALLTILFLSETYGGRIHDKRIAEVTPYPLPAGSRLLQDLGFLAFTLPQVEILMPTKKPRGQELTWEQQLANQALHHRRLRIEHVTAVSSAVALVRCDRSMISWSESVDLVDQECWNPPVHTGLSLPVMAWKPRKRWGSGACRDKAPTGETLEHRGVSVSRIW
jgi:hypothetical protein